MLLVGRLRGSPPRRAFWKSASGFDSVGRGELPSSSLARLVEQLARPRRAPGAARRSLDSAPKWRCSTRVTCPLLGPEGLLELGAAARSPPARMSRQGASRPRARPSRSPARSELDARRRPARAPARGRRSRSRRRPRARGPRPPRSARRTSSAATGRRRRGSRRSRAPSSDVDAGLAEWGGGFHGQEPHATDGLDGSALSGRRSRARPSGSSSVDVDATSTSACPGPARTNVDQRLDGVRRRPRTPPRPCRRRSCAPSRPRRAARPRGASSRGRRRPARARGAHPAAHGLGHRGYGRQMTATSTVELDALWRRGRAPPRPPRGCARCSPTRCARPRRARQAALGLRRAGRGRDRRPATACCSPPTPAAAGAARRPRGRGRARVAAGRRRRRRARRARRARARLTAPTTCACARASSPAASSARLPGRVEPAELAELVAARLRRARRARSTGCAPRALALPPGRDRDVASCKEPIGARHPLRIAEAVARLGGRPARRALDELEDAVLALLGAGGGAAVRPHEDPDPRAAWRPPDPPAARRHGQVGRLPHRVRPPRARLRRQRPRARPGGGGGAAGGGPAGREAVGRPAPRVPQPAPRGRDPRADRDGRGPSGDAAAVNGERMRAMSTPRADRHAASRRSCTRSSRSTRRGSSTPSARTACWHTARALLRYGTTPAAGYTPPPRATPDERRDHRRARHAHLPGGRRAHQRARARARAPTGSGPGDGVAIMCRNHRGLIDAVVACSQARRQRAVPQHGVLRPAADRRAKREKPEGARLRPGVRGGARATPTSRRKRYIAWHEPDEAPATRARGPDRARRHRRPLSPPSEPGKRDHPHLGHDRHAEGRLALDAQVDRPDRRAAGP